MTFIMTLVEIINFIHLCTHTIHYYYYSFITIHYYYYSFICYSFVIVTKVPKASPIHAGITIKGYFIRAGLLGVGVFLWDYYFIVHYGTSSIILLTYRV